MFSFSYCYQMLSGPISGYILLKSKINTWYLIFTETAWQHALKKFLKSSQIWRTATWTPFPAQDGVSCLVAQTNFVWTSATPKGIKIWKCQSPNFGLQRKLNIKKFAQIWPILPDMTDFWCILIIFLISIELIRKIKSNLSILLNLIWFVGMVVGQRMITESLFSKVNC